MDGVADAREAVDVAAVDEAGTGAAGVQGGCADPACASGVEVEQVELVGEGVGFCTGFWEVGELLKRAMKKKNAKRKKCRRRERRERERNQGK